MSKVPKSSTFVKIWPVITEYKQFASIWCCAILMPEAITESQTTLQCPLTCLSQFLLLNIFIHVMVYMSPTKFACIVEQNRWGLPPSEIAQSIGVHHTTVTHILKRFKKLSDYYHVNPKTGCPCKMGIDEGWIVAQVIAKVDAVEIQKKGFPKVSTRTGQRCLKEQGLLCHMWKPKPYLKDLHKQKWWLWEMQHIGWTVEDWTQKRVVTSNLGRLWMTVYLKNDGGGNLMVWGASWDGAWKDFTKMRESCAGQTMSQSLIIIISGLLRTWNWGKLGKKGLFSNRIMTWNTDPRLLKSGFGINTLSTSHGHLWAWIWVL